MGFQHEKQERRSMLKYGGMFCTGAARSAFMYSSDWLALPRLRISKAQFDALPEYSASNPTGVYPGKLWRCILLDGRPTIRGFLECADPTKCSNHIWRPFFTAQDSKQVASYKAQYDQACFL